MSYERPTLQTLIARVVADINARLPGADARLPYSNLNVFSYVMGALAHGLYGFIDYIVRQIFPDTAEAEYLERHASLRKIYRRAAAPATGNVVFTGTTGSTVAAGTLLQRADGMQYQTTSSLTLSSGTGTVGVVAVQAGLSSNMDAGASLNLVSPIVGINAGALVDAAGLTGGSDTELDDDLRARLLQRYRVTPQGGAKADYEAWALEVPGVTRAWVYPGELGAGTVTLRFVRDGDGTGAAIIPDAAEVLAVETYIDALRPVTADLVVVAPVSVPLDFTISGITPNTDAVKAAVQAELQDLLLREAVPGGTLLLSHIRAAISSATGEADYTLVTPSANVANATGLMSTMGTITWT